MNTSSNTTHQPHDQEDQTIYELPPELARLIAAGEVVQHPTSAAKELIENALDAQATSITIEATKAGYDSLIVVDNGTGMSAADLAIAWQPHTTSKLRSIQDFEAIGTFGFRGEALQSLAQVSHLSILSRRATDTPAHTIQLEQGKVLKPLQPSAGTMGTRVHVSALFASVPGRRHPRSLKLETKDLVELVSAYALIFPNVAWKLQLDSQIWTWPVPSSTPDRASQHWTSTTLQDFWPITVSLRSGEVHGLLSEPHVARRRQQGVCSINGRWVEWPALQALVRTAYGTVLEAGMHPAWVLNFSLDPKTIDPNIHPNKRQVRLFQEEQILRELFPLLQLALDENVLALQKEQLWRVSESAPNQAAGKHLKSTTMLPTLESHSAELTQLQKLYLVSDSPDGLVLIDQHAAHERVLYEQFLASWENQNATHSVELKPAKTIQVSPADHLLLQEHHESLQATGWELEPFGTHTWVIRAQPALLSDRDPVSLLKGALDDLSSGLLETSLHPHHHRLLATLACRSAIKAGQELSTSARQELVKQLSQTKTNFSCPHGRPVSVIIPWKEVEKWFHRS